jgi:hypothetical protein
MTLADFPLSPGPDVSARRGVKDAAGIPLAADGCSSFEDAALLAAYAGISPVARCSEASIKGKFPSYSGDKRLKKSST